MCVAWLRVPHVPFGLGLSDKAARRKFEADLKDKRVRKDQAQANDLEGRPKGLATASACNVCYWLSRLSVSVDVRGLEGLRSDRHHC